MTDRSESIGQFLTRAMEGVHAALPQPPQCPECLRTGQRSIVTAAGRIRLRAASIEITRGDQRTLRHAQRVESYTWRCSNGHQWSESR